MMEKIKVICYAINGVGVGHISRLNNICEALDDLAGCVGAKIEISFLTTSEAPQIVERFPVYKIPSRKLVQKFALDPKEYAANTRFFVSNLIGSFRPDILIMDTNPTGNFSEFPMVRAYCKKTIFINRKADDLVENEEKRKDFISRYDTVIVPDSISRKHKYNSDDFKNKWVFVDPIHGFREDTALSRYEVREYFNLNEKDKLLYISAGGGGDMCAEEQIETLLESVSEKENVKILIGYGPLYKGKVRYSDNTIPFFSGNIRKFFKGMDGAICAAGYNTYQELLSAGVPTAFFGQRKGMDRQDLRIIDGSSKGWNLFIEDINDSHKIEEALNILLSDNQISKNLEGREKTAGALNAAIEVFNVASEISEEKTLNKLVYFTALCLKYRTTHIDRYRDYDLNMIVEWALIIQPIIMGDIAWSSFISECVDEYKNKEVYKDEMNFLEKIFSESISVKKVNKYFSEMESEIFISHLKGFLEENPFSRLNPNSLEDFIENNE